VGGTPAFLPRPRAIVCGYLLPSCRRHYLRGHAESAVRVAAESTPRYETCRYPIFAMNNSKEEVDSVMTDVI
jgi:hypothetical protein